MKTDLEYLFESSPDGCRSADEIAMFLCPKTALGGPDQYKLQRVHDWVRQVTEHAVRTAWERQEAAKRQTLDERIKTTVVHLPDGFQQPATEAQILTVEPALAPTPFVYDRHRVRISLREILFRARSFPYPHEDLARLGGDLSPTAMAVWHAAELVGVGISRNRAAELAAADHGVAASTVRDNLKPSGLSAKVRAVLPERLIELLGGGEKS